MLSETSTRVGFGIVTALPIEYAAIRQLLERPRQVALPPDPTQYLIGELPSSRKRRPHTVALTVLPRDGTRTAAAACANLLAAFPSIRTIAMIGIAGGIPAVNDPRKHVRLGDIVVATEIIDYGHVRSVDGSQQLRGRIDGPSVDLVSADRILQANEVSEERPWETWLGAGSIAVLRVFARPEDVTDVLMMAGESVAHPDDSSHGRRPGFPRVHRGVVASGDQLIRDEATRDRLAAKYGACAIEMEAVGVAAGTMLRGVPWFMVRGIADYCDNTKNDLWHPYASLAAAAYLRALLAHCEPMDGSGAVAVRPGAVVAETSVPVNHVRVIPRQASTSSPIHYLQAIVEAMLDVEEILDNGSRPMLVAMLPRNIQTAIMHQASARLEVISIVRTCAGFHDGQRALLMAMRACVPDGSMALERAEAVIVANWHGLMS